MSSGTAFTLKQLVDRFEEAWQSGAAPPVEDFVSSVLAAVRFTDETIREALKELVAIDLEYRWRQRLGSQGYRPRLEDYVARLPKLGPWDTLPADLIGSEYRARRRWGDRPAPEEYARRFPHHGPELLQMLARIDAQITAEFAWDGGAQPMPVAWRAEPIHSVPAFVEALRASAILPAAQQNQLAGAFLGRFSQPQALAKELLQRNWLTPYQVNQIFQGRSQGLVMGPYLVLERLGEGGAGQVFKACHQKMNRLVALKIVRKELLADPEVVGRFYREIQVVSQLDHPNVVHAYDAGPIGPTHFLAMEYVKGVDLGRMVKQVGPLPVLQACAYIRQAALGLQHAHERGLVHRDIKPHNLMLSVGDGLVKVLDLGLARLRRAVNEEVTAVLTSKTTNSLTPVNAVMMGTADYLAPEQALDFHRADIRADIYSLGCTFFYLLAGRPPFAGGTLAEKVAKHMQSEPPAVRGLRDDVPPELDLILRKMLAKKPEERFQTPGEVAAALTTLQAKDGFSGQLPRRRRARWPRIIAAGLLMGLLAIAGVLALPNRNRNDAGARIPVVNQLEVRWDPLAKQVREPDTLFLLDVDNERTIPAGAGGLIAGNPLGNKEWTKVVPEPGKYRRGIRCTKRDYGYLWMPMLGLVPTDEFTIELWLRCDKPWAEVNGQTPLNLLHEDWTETIRLDVHGGQLTLGYRHAQDPAGPVVGDITYDLKKHPLAGGVWVNLAITYKDKVLRLFVNGKSAGERTGVAAPRLWTDGYPDSGLCLLGCLGYGADHFALSDLRISRRARQPGQKLIVSDENVLTVHADQPTGESVCPTLLGTLYEPPAGRAEKISRGVVRLVRTRKLLGATPIKSGGPDAAHPSPGVSGKFSYNWALVDRELGQIQRAGAVAYVSIDSTPFVLGGGSQPWSAEQLRQSTARDAPFNPEVPRNPRNLDAFGAIVRDLVHHAILERKFPVRYWGIGHEPDHPHQWKGTRDEYLSLYEMCSRAIRFVNPTLQVGGPETVEWNPAWVEALIKHCGTHQTPLSFISWHNTQSTSLSVYVRARSQVNRWAKMYGVKDPIALVVGEWGSPAASFPYVMALRPQPQNFFVNDWHAAFVSASLIEMQHAGVVVSVYSDVVSDKGLIGPTQPWANWNAYQLWARLAPQLLAVRYEGAPGIFTLASRDERGRITILLARVCYRKGEAVPVTIKLVGGPAEARTTLWAIDDRHANQHDAGRAHALLESIPCPPVREGAVTLTLPARSVQMLVVEPTGSK